MPEPFSHDTGLDFDLNEMVVAKLGHEVATSTIQTILDTDSAMDAYKASLGRLVDFHVAEILGSRDPSTVNFHVISPVSDFDTLALPVVQRLRALGAHVMVSCAWIFCTPLDEDGHLHFAPIKVSMRDEVEKSDYEVVIVASVLEVENELESIMIHSVYCEPFLSLDTTRIHVVTAAARSDVRQRFKNRMISPHAETFAWHCAATSDHFSRVETMTPARRRLIHSGMDESRGYVPAYFRRPGDDIPIRNPHYRPPKES